MYYRENNENNSFALLKKVQNKYPAYFLQFNVTLFLPGTFLREHLSLYIYTHLNHTQIKLSDLDS